MSNKQKRIEQMILNQNANFLIKVSILRNIIIIYSAIIFSSNEPYKPFIEKIKSNK